MRAKVKNGIGLLINAYQLAAICVLIWLLIVAIALFLTEPAHGATIVMNVTSQSRAERPENKVYAEISAPPLLKEG